MANLPIEQIKQLYYEERLSCFEVAEKIGVSQTVVLKFMIKHGLPRRNFYDCNVVRFERKPLTFSVKENLSPEEEKLKIAGLMIYWAEGAKISTKRKSCTVDLANSNPEMVKLFLRFLREICQIEEEKTRIFLYCYIDQDIEKIKDFWSDTTKIPLTQFTKPYIRKDFTLEKSGKMKYGLVHIRYNDKKLLLQLDKWIREFVSNMGMSDSSNSTSL
ncbi:MAG: hypothetical protein AAB842_02925 [Patescibacteria group bacterium]